MPDYPDKANQDFDDVLTQNAKEIVLRIINQIAEVSVLEAENATLSGPTVETLNAGFTGTGYADYGTTPGQYIEWNVNAPQAGIYTLDFRYANGAAANRPLELRVNAAVDQAALAFNPTGAWTTWQHVTEQVALNAGSNIVRLTMNGIEGPNIDNLDFTFVAPIITPPAAPDRSPGQCRILDANQPVLDRQRQQRNGVPGRASARLRRLVRVDRYARCEQHDLSATPASRPTRSTCIACGRPTRRALPTTPTRPTPRHCRLGSTTPSVTSVNPGPGATGVFLDRDIVATVSVPNGGINPATMSAEHGEDLSHGKSRFASADGAQHVRRRRHHRRPARPQTWPRTPATRSK